MSRLAPRLRHLFASRPVQGALVLVAAVASIATSAPAWGIDETAGVRNLTLAPRATAARVVATEGSQPVFVSSTLQGMKASRGARFTLTLEALDPPEAGCTSLKVSFTPKDENAWSTLTEVSGRADAGADADADAGGADAGGAVGAPRSFRGDSFSAGLASTPCNDGLRHRTRATVTNDGTTPLDIAWEITGSISGSGTDEPDGAFVRIADEAP